MLPNNLIFIIDDQVEICEIIEQVIIRNISNIRVKTFTDVNDMLSDPDILDVDLFVIDVFLGNYDGRDLCDLIIDKGNNSPVLFVSGRLVTADFFEDTKNCYAVDFIEKPFVLPILINRIKVLLALSNTYQQLQDKIEEEQKKVKFREQMMWDLFNHSHFYVIVINHNTQLISLANYKLAIDLGFKSEDELVGRSCFDFIPENQRDLINVIKSQLCCVGNSSKFREFTFDMQTLDGKIILVKWFNSYINTTEHVSFSIGIPIKQPSYEDSIDSIRDYFNTILDKDRVMIDAMNSILARDNG
jgi:PAS domain S-box-containing protein